MLAVLLLALTQAAAAPVPAIPATQARVLEGRSRETAIKVGSVAEEYALIRRRGLTSSGQALIRDQGRAYDRLTVVDPGTGIEQELWFDITRFFGKEF